MASLGIVKVVKSLSPVCLERSVQHLRLMSPQEMDVAYATNVLVLGYNNTLEPGYSLYIPSEVSPLAYCFHLTRWEGIFDLS